MRHPPIDSNPHVPSFVFVYVPVLQIFLQHDFVSMDYSMSKSVTSPPSPTSSSFVPYCVGTWHQGGVWFEPNSSFTSIGTQHIPDDPIPLPLTFIFFSLINNIYNSPVPQVCLEDLIFPQWPAPIKSCTLYRRGSVALCDALLAKLDVRFDYLSRTRTIVEWFLVTDPTMLKIKELFVHYNESVVLNIRERSRVQRIWLMKV